MIFRKTDFYNFKNRLTRMNLREKTKHNKLYFKEIIDKRNKKKEKIICKSVFGCFFIIPCLQFTFILNIN